MYFYTVVVNCWDELVNLKSVIICGDNLGVGRTNMTIVHQALSVDLLDCLIKSCNHDKFRG